jgi:hypothetical protein
MSGTGRIISRSANHPIFESEAAAVVRAQQAAKEAAQQTVRGVGYGLGDVAYRVAHPIGCWLDRRTARLGGAMAWAKTGLCGCSACSRRRRWLNALVPDVRRWNGGWQVGCKRVAEAVQRGFLGFVDRMF